MKTENLILPGEPKLTLHKLINNLKNIGFNISISEIIDAHKLLSIAENTRELRIGLRVIFAKSLQEQLLFDLNWNSFYNKNKQRTDKEYDLPIKMKTKSKSFCIGVGGNRSGGGAGNLTPGETLIRFSSQYKGVARQLFEGNPENAAAILMRILMANSMSLAEITRKKENAIREIKHMINTIVPQSSNTLIPLLEEEYRKLMQNRLNNPTNMGKNPLSSQKIENIPMILLKNTPELQIALKKLSRKFATKYKRRHTIGQQRINLRKTIRSNIQNGGTIIKPIMERKKLSRTKLIVMTDVSSSTIHATRLFLQIIWNAKEVFQDIRFFEFISNTIEVTREFKRAKTINIAIENSIKLWKRVSDGGKQNSDYHQALSKFIKITGSALSSKTTIIILGDLRDWLGPWTNNKPKSAEIMHKIKNKVKRIIVLNPEKKSLWNGGDSIVKYVQDYGIEVYEINTLSALIDVLMIL